MEKRPILTLDSFKKQKTDQKSNDEVVRQEQNVSTDKQNTQKPASNKTKEAKTAIEEVIASPQKKSKNTSITDEEYQKILSYLNQHYPKCFPTEGELVPLAVGIHNQILAIDDLPFPRINIRRFLGRYTRGRKYRKNLLAGRDRFDLHGQKVAKILPEEVDNFKWKKVKSQKKTEAVKKANHDSLIKKAMESPIAAKELLSEYLPAEFKDFINLDTLKIEKESFIEDSLKTKFSDIIYSAKAKESANNTSNSKDVLIYTLLEHQSTPDYWVALRLWKYCMLLLERHAKGKEKLPVIIPLVLYNGKKKYNAPLNIWDLFSNSELAKQTMSENYRLIDLESMSDDEIDYEKHLSFLLYVMKHIHDRDTLSMLKDVMAKCTKALIIDKGQDYVHTKLIFWYTNSKVPAENKQLLEEIIVNNLPKEDQEVIMRTVADTYIDEGIAIGEARGIQKGATNKVIEIARRMLQEKTDIKFISSVTGLSSDEILKLQNKS